MKKIFILISLILFIVFMSRDEYTINENTIRFRVISNSNSAKDIIMKEKVVDELSTILFEKTNSLEETEKNIVSNIPRIESKIDNLFLKNNYDKTYNISYGLNEFPKKTYRGKTYEAGLYNSLVIEIGEAKGNNYFCILYPSLCLLDYENKEEQNEKVEYRFKIVDLFKKIF